FFFFNAPPPPEPYTLSLHDALPIYHPLDLAAPHAGHRIDHLPALGGDREHHLPAAVGRCPASDQTLCHEPVAQAGDRRGSCPQVDRKSTRLNSSHLVISYAVFCLKK